MIPALSALEFSFVLTANDSRAGAGPRQVGTVAVWFGIGGGQRVGLSELGQDES